MLLEFPKYILSQPDGSKEYNDLAAKIPQYRQTMFFVLEKLKEAQ